MSSTACRMLPTPPTLAAAPPFPLEESYAAERTLLTMARGSDALWGSGTMTPLPPLPFQLREDTGVCGGVRKFSLACGAGAATAAARSEVEPLAAAATAALFMTVSLMLRLARACWWSWFLDAAACTSDGGRPMFWYWDICAASATSLICWARMNWCAGAAAE